jgi:signal transduction histidine kinase
MSADQLVQILTQALFLLIFLHVLIRAVRAPRRANLDIALLFGVVALTIAQGWVVAALDLQRERWLETLGGALIMSLPYLLLRLVDDFADLPRPVLGFALLGLLASVVALVLVPAPRPDWLTLALVAYFVGLLAYTAFICRASAAASSGVTRRRLQAVALGAAFLGLTILAAGLQAVLAEQRAVWESLGRVMGLGSGLCFFLGFATPLTLRRAWREPELRRFLGQAATLPHLADRVAIVQELRRGAATATGAPAAAIGLWDQERGTLRYEADGGSVDVRLDQGLASRSFVEQRARFWADARRDDPIYGQYYDQYGARALLVALISAGGRRLGVLVVYAPRAPIFADDDLELVQLLADQAATVLQSRALIDEAARARARDEAARFKEDFLSSAAHDLRSPLTVLLTQAQLLERRALRAPSQPADLVGIRRLIDETRRLTHFVSELLDVGRIQEGNLITSRETVDLAALAREVCARYSTERNPCRLEGHDSLLGYWDQDRIRQMIGNLVENAVKYSPAGGSVRLRIWSEPGRACLLVEDHGIGIPTPDLPRLFARFHRGSNVDDRRFAGLGLGLHISRAIAEQHGGSIEVASQPGQGTIFRVSLPLQPAQGDGPLLAPPAEEATA